MKVVGLHRFGFLLAVVSLLLLVAGALVTGGVLPQQVHRTLGVLVGLLTLGLLIWLWLIDRRPWLRWLAVAALLLVVLQGILGALTALYGLPVSVSITHACAAQLFFALVAAIVSATSRSWQDGVLARQDSGQLSLRLLASATSVGILAQAALGAAYRHGALGIVPHAIGGAVVTGLVLLLSTAVLTPYRGRKPVAKSAKRLLVITLHQVVLGVLAYVAGIISGGASRFLGLSLTVAHIAVGALTLAAAVILMTQIARNAHAQVTVT